MTTESHEIKRLVSERYAKDAKAVIELTACRRSRPATPMHAAARRARSGR